MTLGRNEDVDPYLRSLATAVASKSEHIAPEVIVKLKDILHRKSVEGSEELRTFKQDLYTTEILQYCSDALTYNYDTVQGGYETAVNIAEIVSTCCVGLDGIKKREKFHKQFLPLAADNLSSLAVCIMDAALEAKKSASIIHFGKIMDSIFWLLKGHGQLIQHVLQSKYYEKIQLCDNEEIGKISLLFLQHLIESNSEFFIEIRHGTLNAILDDIVYKLGCSSSSVTCSMAINTLLLIARKSHSVAELISGKYEGLKAMLKNDWNGKGFDAEVEQLSDLLYPEVQHKEASLLLVERETKAAYVIQATWRGFQTRKRMKTLSKAAVTFQRKFREMRQQQKLQSEKKKAEEDFLFQVHLRRQRAQCQFRQRQLYLLEIVPADQMDRYLCEVEHRAAINIQKVWRGYRERKNFQQQKQALKKSKAAVIIQRAALAFLKRRRAMRQQLSPWRGTRHLTDTIRTDLTKEVKEYITLHPSNLVSMESCTELHLKTQELLLQNLMKKDKDQRAEQHRQALLAQINTDIELLMSAPPLRNSSGLDVDAYLSRSAPVASWARQSHSTVLQVSRSPWWMKFGETFSDHEF
ncbi:IQ calmodulin-binding motif-containing protein 1 [Brienomyrus brachyistius]|uniref:IQ calmodulin-binding motif-containing protein 1 n=1 Tax=Brienomyrus brachyistius TaxID=42636 RepID=UPI0020B204BB|nr:IQ calmodulin-binding motif-containing protein 1 [Brienomyrus brachyistius]XP_048878349.1 IQ calmodulin-binding motif-containing protein 1 [Brienomyrus brachyistius]